MSQESPFDRSRRLAGLRRFAVAITVLNVAGHTFLGFEQSLLQPLVALAAAYAMELALEAVAARQERRTPRFARSRLDFVDFLLPAHISGMAVAMLLYASDRLWPIAFAAAVAIGSKALFLVPVGGAPRHFFNPSNLGITVTLLLFPWVGIAPPYMFTENLSGWADWLLPAVIVVSGSFLNARFTGRIPLILAWVGGFAAQAWIRSEWTGLPLTSALLPMTGVAFLLFTFYMVTDPATAPVRPAGQVAFGLAVAAGYGMLMSLHVVFGLFFALSIVCALRGAGLYAAALVARTSAFRAAFQGERAPAPAVPAAARLAVLASQTER